MCGIVGYTGIAQRSPGSAGWTCPNWNTVDMTLPESQSETEKKM